MMILVIVLAADVSYLFIIAHEPVTEADVQLSFLPESQPLEKTMEGDWTKENGIRIHDGSSPCTIMLPNGTYRMYYTRAGGIVSAFSSDGLRWINESGVRISPEGMGSNQEKILSCAVIEIPDGYRMIYEGVQGEPPNDVHRFFSANSTDSLNWTKEDGVRLESVGTSDYGQVSAPDIVILPDGSLRMYYVGDFYHKGAEGNSIRSAISYDFGLTWTREGIRLLGEDTTDPDIIMLAGGEYRIFYSASPLDHEAGNMSVYSAWSPDGLNWTLELGLRLAPSRSYDIESCMDPDVVRLQNGSYRMYYSGMNSSGETNILSAVRLPFSLEGNLALDFSESKFYFVYPMDRLSFRFKGTNVGIKNIVGGMDQCYGTPVNYVHVIAPQGTNLLAPGESMWFKVLLGAEPYGSEPTPEGKYNFTLHLRFNFGLPDNFPALDNTHIFVKRLFRLRWLTALL